MAGPMHQISMPRSILLSTIGALAIVLTACSANQPMRAIDDPVGDAGRPGVDGPVVGPDYVDIRALAADIDGSTLRLKLTVAGSLPVPPSVDSENLEWIVVLRTGADAEAVRDLQTLRVGFRGYAVTLRNRGAGAYAPALVEMPGSTVRGEGAEFPGTVAVDGDTVSWTVPLAALGNPGLIRAGVWAQRVGQAPGYGTTAWDFLPGDDSSGSAAGWLTLEP
ncbi:MAG: hypothetical protein ABI598_07080 [Chloroflexota bacterium]